MCYSITVLKYSKSILKEDIEAIKKYFLTPDDILNFGFRKIVSASISSLRIDLLYFNTVIE